MTKKRTYKIGDVCKLLDIQPYVLRYWETEFSALEPQKSQSGQRVYGESEIAVIRRVKQLLYEEGYTIAGAKKKLDAERETGAGSEAGPLFHGDEMAENGAAEPAGDPQPEPAKRLDTPPHQRIESLRDGLRDALAEARALLAMLDGPTR